MNTPVNAPSRRRDRGTALLLTIAFVVMIGAIGGGLAGLVTSGLNNTVTLARLRDRQYAADGAVESAIAEVRTAMEASSLDPCVAGASGTVRTALNEVEIRVDWSGACGVVQGSRSGVPGEVPGVVPGAGGLIFLQRDVAFTACLDIGEPCTHDTAILSARVNFGHGDDGTVRSTVIQSWSVDQ